MGSQPRTERGDAPVVIGKLLSATAVAHERQAQLQTALESRIVLEQAKGMLAERLGTTVDDAFAVLRKAARSRRIKLHDAARAVVEHDPVFAAFLREQRR